MSSKHGWARLPKENAVSRGDVTDTHLTRLASRITCTEAYVILSFGVVQWGTPSMPFRQLFSPKVSIESYELLRNSTLHLSCPLLGLKMHGKYYDASN